MTQFDALLTLPKLSREAERLEAKGFDGLYHPDPAVACGCFLSDLRPCGETGTGCRGGHVIEDGVDGPYGVFKPRKKRR